MSFRTRQAALAATLFLTTVATAHEHHTDNVEEGHAISDDPVVRCNKEAQLAWQS